MFVLRTGLQGNGKTLNTIKEVDIKAAKENRTVFYHNIRGFNPQFEGLKATWVAFDDPHKWFELPENAIIVIDEAQQFFRIRNQASAVPAYASALETMRHQGHELHCITQNPSLIDHHFRKLCNVIDEAQQFFRIRNQASAVPAYASALETMRHQGHELHCITQNPSLIDHHFRKLCN
ncbi:zonular occludens toxin domain-containing protein, partial [Vibrio splendidus]|uniref:zonular occludens toxin domain-containing protein n=1 Tax=Vibrio splendidus TaxID=29497 RepID=UPI001F275673